MAYDLLIKGGTVYDGTGKHADSADVAVLGDQIVAVGQLEGEEAAQVLDASGLAVAPGFINVLSHSYFTLLQDPRSLGELLQGVTTQIIGEGMSMAPLNESMKVLLKQMSGRFEIEAEWNRMSEYLNLVEKRGTSQNIASFIGATSLRMCVMDYENRPATESELDKMRALTEEEMADGALGIGSALIYPPGLFAPTEELIEICRVASRYGGKYFSHLRSEGDIFLEGLAELLRISTEAVIPAEVWHLKAAGKDNWPKLDQAIEIIEQAQQRGDPITADMYPYTAGATGLVAAIPPWFHEGGFGKLLEHLQDEPTRQKIRTAIEGNEGGWENIYKGCGGAENILILDVEKDELRGHQGRTLAAIAAEANQDPIDALMDLVLETQSAVLSAFFLMSDENVSKQIRLPWVSFGSDAGSMAPEGLFLEFHTHPRAYGTFARVLGKYVREDQAISLPEAIRRMTGFPAQTLELDRRGLLEPGYFADITVFDSNTIADTATYENPHSLAVGVKHVVVNGNVVLNDGEFTGSLPGRALFGRGKR